MCRKPYTFCNAASVASLLMCRGLTWLSWATGERHLHYFVLMFSSLLTNPENGGNSVTLATKLQPARRGSGWWRERGEESVRKIMQEEIRMMDKPLFSNTESVIYLAIGYFWDFKWPLFLHQNRNSISLNSQHFQYSCCWSDLIIGYCSSGEGKSKTTLLLALKSETFRPFKLI